MDPPTTTVSSTPLDAARRDKQQPPPETKESIWLRRAAILSFWAVVVLLGLPVWLKTTAIYRAELPLQHMTDWAEGKVCKPVFPLRIAVESPIASPDGLHLVRMTQHALDDLNEFPAHHLRLMLSDAPLLSNASQQVVRDGTTMKSDDKDVALVVRLIPVETGATPRSQLRTHSPTLDVYYSPNQMPLQSSTGSPLATFVAQELHKIFAEEQAQLAHLLSTSGVHAANTRLLSPETSAELQRQSTRALKYAPTYHLTFSLFSPTYAPSAWDVDAALRHYLAPLLESFSAISNFTVDTQVQLYATSSPSIRQPEYDEDAKAWMLRKEDLSGFINAAEWPLSPSIGEGPTVNFILYVPDKDQSPLLVKENAGTSWLVPQWGGVHILNLEHESSTPSALTAAALAPAMHTFSNQLISLFGLPQTPASLPLRISTLERVRAASLIFSASSTLGALAQVYQKLPSIPVPDNVAQSADLTIVHLQQACDFLREGRFQNALEHARVAEIEAEKAFFERSMVGQVYFPDEHKVAVYLPLLGPVAVPLVMAALKELKSIVPRCRTLEEPRVEFLHSAMSLVRHNLRCTQNPAAGGATSPRIVVLRPAHCLAFYRAYSSIVIEAHPSHAMPLSAQGIQSVKDVLDDAVLKEGLTGCPGLVFHAVDKSGKTIAEYAAGTRGLDSKEPMDQDTVFWIASCTKLVTGIAVLQLVEQNKIPLDDSEFVKKIAPEIAEKKVYADGVTPTDQQKGVTMRMLLSHTAGFAYSFIDGRAQTPNGLEGVDGNKSDILDSKMVNQPGSMWEYGISMDWAGIILERVSGQTLGDYFAEHIFAPLGISPESASMFPSKQTQKTLAHMHQRNSTSGQLEKRSHLYSGPLKKEYTKDEKKDFLQSGGAGLFAKPNQYTKILAAILNGGTSPQTGKTILKKETIDLMWENQIPDQPNFARGGPPPAKPELLAQTPEFYPQPNDPAQGWAFGGFLTIEPGPSGRGANTLWWMGLANCFWWVDREKGVAGMLASQVLPNPDPKVVPAWFNCEKAIYDNLE
ncbi:beta-lactamase/transpeptidase-like protein [Dothidotthia symphoricarpi CBS 119687]|uniref:Beta-lactamase/transpeptidase-like protein n=1 Tax=Dothidotthia symphoricarpi CBS 119687 TaxID=1392245 RepID=A0A6A6ALE5_9PLEO|nr:beta-lactamase/transpeptidase-like protein [Dothidotthia symphoricarpi CBS 119687]KAF2132013.1 beta-lactamase/transpeptidase-like protein [Dothidotthia symphoricarpi CBS 119687]